MFALIVGKFTDKHRRQFLKCRHDKEQKERWEKEKPLPNVAQHSPILKRKQITGQGMDWMTVNV